MKHIKRLIISPHIDDELLGCYSILNKDTFVLYCGVEDRSYVNREERIAELEAVRKKTGFTYEVLPNTVNSYKIPDLIPAFEKIINTLKPEQVFIPYPSYNQDHRAVYDAVLVALRPHDINHFVKKVLVYEECHVFFWSHNHKDPFNPTHFIPLDIEEKLASYHLMKSQVRSFRSPEHLRSMAILRGGQSNCAHAEGFVVLRWIE